jgi:cytochrome c biogenesis factor
LFREQLLWTRDVNLTLDANKEGILTLYERYSQNKQKKMSRSEAMQLLTQDSNIKLSEKDA